MRSVLGKAAVAVFAVVMAVSLAGVSSAQEAKKSEIKTIFDYKDDLKLTDQQIKKMKEILVELNNEATIARAKLIIVNADFQELLKSEGDMEKIKAKIREAHDLQATLQISDIEASRSINAVLSQEQLKKWKEIQAAARNK